MFMEKYFGTTWEIKLKELMDKFKCHPFYQNKVYDNVKACMFYLLETVFLSGYKNKFKIIQGNTLVNSYS